MKELSARFATTHVDLQGEQAGVEALQAMVEALNAHYVPFGVEHDPRIPPVGRISSASLESIEDGHFAVSGTIDVWESSDTVDGLRGDGRTPPPPTVPDGLFEVFYDRPSIKELGVEPFADLARLAGERARPQYLAKKALDPLSTIAIACGCFALSGIATGFLGKLGEDVYAAFKSQLGRLARPRPTGERLIVLQFGVETAGRMVAVDLIATNPSPEDVVRILDSGLKYLDRLVAATLRDRSEAAKVVASWDGSGVALLYSVREDGVPSVLRPIPPDRLASGHLSVGGPVEIDEADA